MCLYVHICNLSMICCEARHATAPQAPARPCSSLFFFNFFNLSMIWCEARHATAAASACASLLVFDVIFFFGDAVFFFGDFPFFFSGDFLPSAGRAGCIFGPDVLKRQCPRALIYYYHYAGHLLLRWVHLCLVQLTTTLGIYYYAGCIWVQISSKVSALGYLLY